MSTTIRKVVFPSHGDASVVQVVDAFIEPPAANEVQVKVLYAGMGGADVQMREGVYPNQKKAPMTPGYSVVGRVHVNGPSSSKYQKGDMVVCLSIYDGDAEYANLPEKYLIPVPQGLDPKQAVAMVLDWNTAYGMVFRSGKVTKGQRVFIHGLSGAVGYALFALCKVQGAEIYGTASQSKHEELRAEGANPFVYTDKNWIDAMNNLGGAHVVFDPLGFESFDESWSILAREGGHLIGYGGNGPIFNGGKPRSQIPAITKLLARNAVPFCPQKTSFYYISRDQKTYKPEVRALFDLCLEGKIRVPFKKMWTLEEVPEAHRTWNKNTAIGSVLVKVAKDEDL